MPSESERLSQLMTEAGMLDEAGNLVDEAEAADADTEEEPSEAGQPESQPSLEELQRLREELEDQKRRNSGLQRKLQPTLRENQALKNRLKGIDEQIFASTLQGLPPAERERQLVEYRAKRDAQLQREELVQTQEAMEQTARSLTIWELSRMYGVDPNLLDRVKSPDSDDMQLVAELMSPYELVVKTDPESGVTFRVPKLDDRGQPVRKAQSSTQPERKRPRFESGSGSPVPPPKAKNLNEAAELFVRLAKQRGYS